MELLEKLAASLSPDARAFLLRDGGALRAENDVTRTFINKFRLPNPLRMLHSKKYASVRIGEQPTRLMNDDHAVVEQLRFFFCGEYEADGNKYDRWTGPDGCVILESTGDRRFLAVYFDDEHRITMHPDIAPKSAELFPTTNYLVGSDDILDDYRRILEAVVDHIGKTGARPLYRYADAALDLACEEYYHRHLVSMSFVKFAMSTRFWTTVGESFPTAADDVMSEQEARDLIAGFNNTTRVGADGIIQTCVSCNTVNETEFSHVGEPTRCDGCGKQIGTASGVVIATDASATLKLLNEVPLPTIVCFWDPRVWSSAMGACFLHDATLRNDQKFLSVLVDVTHLDVFREDHQIDAVPTYIKFVGGFERGRVTNAISEEEIREFVFAQ